MLRQEGISHRLFSGGHRLPGHVLRSWFGAALPAAGTRRKSAQRRRPDARERDARLPVAYRLTLSIVAAEAIGDTPFGIVIRTTTT
jgi:hypothetical protein